MPADVEVISKLVPSRDESKYMSKCQFLRVIRLCVMTYLLFLRHDLQTTATRGV